MSFDKTRIYYNAIFGAIGGLLAWALVGLIIRFPVESTFMLFVKDALQGAIVGLCVGLALGVVDGLTVSHSTVRTIRGGCTGAFIGVGAGLIGLILGEVIFLFAGGGVWPRAIGWAVFGFLLGTAEGVANASPRKASYGAVGGLLGGLIGGSTYERASLLLRTLTQDRDLAMTVGGAMGLIILGACIGSLITLSEEILRRAWLKGIRGRLEGRTLTLAKTINTLGRAERVDIRIPGDPDVVDHHADIRQTAQGFIIEAKGGTVLVDQQPVSQHTLQAGQKIQLGQSVLIFFTE